MEAPENLGVLHKLDTRAGKRDVRVIDFASNFDLPPA